MLISPCFPITSPTQIIKSERLFPVSHTQMSHRQVRTYKQSVRTARHKQTKTSRGGDAGDSFTASSRLSRASLLPPPPRDPAPRPPFSFASPPYSFPFLTVLFHNVNLKTYCRHAQLGSPQRIRWIDAIFLFVRLLFLVDRRQSQGQLQFWF